MILFIVMLIGGALYTAWSLGSDVAATGTRTTTWVPFLLLGIALLIALGFEFVNGFHDTANAVATVIYTHSLPPNVAVVWSGRCGDSAGQRSGRTGRCVPALKAVPGEGGLADRQAGKHRE